MLIQPSRSFRRRFTPGALLLLGLCAVATLSTNAQGLPPNTVEDFRQFLRNDLDKLGKLKQLAMKVDDNVKKNADDKSITEAKLAYYKKLQESVDARWKKDEAAAKTRADVLEKQVTTVADAAGVLRLREWEQADTRIGMDALDKGALRDRLADKFQTLVQADVANGRPRDQAALCVLLGEDAVYSRTLKREGLLYYNTVRKLIPEVVKLSEKTGAEYLGVREAATKALAQMYAPAEQQVAAVQRLLKEDGENTDARRNAYKSLILPFETASPRFLASQSGALQYSATDQIAYRAETRGLLEKHAALAIPTLVKGLKDSDLEVRQASINALRDIAAILLVPLEPAPRLGKDVVDYDFRLKPMHDVIVSIQPLLDRLAENAPALIEAAADANHSVREQALAMLNDLTESRNRVRGWNALFERAKQDPDKLEGAADKALPAEFAALQAKPDQSVPPSDKLTPALKKALDVLSLNLKSPDVVLRMSALDTLEDLGQDALPLLPAIVHALQDKDKFVRWSAIRILNRFGPVEAATVVPALTPLISYPDSDVARLLGPTLSKYGTRAASAVPELTKAIQNAEPDTRISYLQTLTFVGPTAVDAVPAIIPLLQYRDPHVRSQAAETLGRFGKAAMKAAPALRTALEDENPDVRKAAGEALLRVDNK